MWSELASRKISRCLIRFELVPPPLGLVHGLEPELSTLPLPEDAVLHLAELLHDHLDTVGVDHATFGQETLEAKKSVKFCRLW